MLACKFINGRERLHALADGRYPFVSIPSGQYLRRYVCEWQSNWLDLHEYSTYDTAKRQSIYRLLWPNCSNNIFAIPCVCITTKYSLLFRNISIFAQKVHFSQIFMAKVFWGKFLFLLWLQRNQLIKIKSHSPPKAIITMKINVIKYEEITIKSNTIYFSWIRVVMQYECNCKKFSHPYKKSSCLVTQFYGKSL